MHEGIVEKLYKEYTVRGFISEDYIFDVLEENGISLFDVEYICDLLLSKGVIIRDDASTEDDEEYDKSNIDYEEVYREVLEIDDSLFDLIEYIRKIQPPQYREWINLMPQAKLNNTYARNRIFEMYMKIAVRMALTYSKKYQLPLDETVQNALLGLHYSIDKYEIARQDNFTSYFPFWVRQFIMRDTQILNLSMYFPTHIKEKLFVVYDKMKEYNGGIWTSNVQDIELFNTISKEIEFSLDGTIQLIYYLKPFDSVEELIENEKSEMLFSDAGTFSEEMIVSLDRLFDATFLHEKLRELTDREQDVLMMRYGIGFDHEYTLEEVGIRLGVTRERVRQIEYKALRKMRRKYNIKRE